MVAVNGISISDNLPYKKGQENSANTKNSSKGIEYSKNIIFDSLKNPNAQIEKSENENGSFLEIIDAENSQTHKLRDTDFDGVYDSYQYSTYDEQGNRTFYNDHEFDGEFDLVGYEFPYVSAIDTDADGEIDYYEHPEF